MRKHYCEIHVEAADESRTPTEPCGKMATWSSEDIVAGTTVWMCDAHQRDIAMRSDAEIVRGE